MIAGASWAWWVGFHAVVAALLAVDAWSSRRREKREQQFSWRFLVLLVVAAACLAGWIAWTRGRQSALEFVAGYTIEVSLSIDNLLVFLVLFTGFEIGPARQHKALLWGVWGAIVLRALLIVVGIGLLQRFDWISWIFGAFLLYIAWRLLRGRSTQEVIPQWIRRLQPARGSLLPVILAVEFTDLIFATDSIPAVLSVTRNPFIAYTSNIAAILGLRSLYFGMSAMLNRLRYLHYGLAALMAFAGFKMLTARWFQVPIGISLGVIAAILAVTALASMKKAGT